MVDLKILREAEAGIQAAEIEVSARLYVGNVPLDAQQDDIQRAFEEAGSRQRLLP